MAKSNYAAWHIHSSLFSDTWPNIQKLQFFARYAILAPSGHNTQPWRFAANGDVLELHADRSRHLPYSGVQANEPYVSLGACLQTLQLAAQGFGYEVAITYVLKDTLVATVTLGKGTTAEPALIEAITKRSSNRFAYEKKSLSTATLESLTKTSLANASGIVLSDENDIAFIADETNKATYRTFGDKEFRTELSKWVRNNITKQHDGMPGFAQGIPTPPSMLAKHIIKRLDISKDQAKKDTGRILNSANLILVVAKDMTPISLLDGGRFYAQVGVLAELHGLASTGVGTAVVDAVSKKDIAAHFALKGEPIAIIRVGKAKKRAKHTPRWPLEKVTS